MAAEERKVVTAVFVDLVGFTTRSERLDPEDVRGFLAPYHARAKAELERFGGTVEKFIGDAVVAVFGAPTAHEDDAERAVRAALAVRDAISELNADDPSLGLSVRIGAATGEALVNLNARPEQGEQLAAGDVLNTASRLQSAAPPDGILVDEATHRLTENVIDHQEAEPVVAKGKADPSPHGSPSRRRRDSESTSPSAAAHPWSAEATSSVRSSTASLARSATDPRNSSPSSASPGSGRAGSSGSSSPLSTQIRPSTSPGGRAAPCRTETASRSGLWAR